MSRQQLLTEIEWKLRVVMSLSVCDEVNLVLPALLLKALLGAPVLANTAACQDNDQSPHQPEPCRESTHLIHILTNRYKDKVFFYIL